MNQITKCISLRSFAVAILMTVMSGTRGQSVNLYELVGFADKNYPLLQQRQAEIAYSQLHEHTVRSAALPTVAVQEQPDYGTVNSVAGAYFPLGLVPSLSGGNA